MLSPLGDRQTWLDGAWMIVAMPLGDDRHSASR